MESVTLIITTFNWPEAIEKVLETVTRQTIQPKEILIADDGSSLATTKLIQRIAASFTLPIKHIWQPNSKFRAARARNLAILKSTCSYLLMIDGDCLLPPNFIEAHLRLRKPKRLIAGGRILLDAEETKLILDSKAANETSPLKKFRLKLCYLNLGIIRDFWMRDWRIARTCNLSLERGLIIDEVAGFDEGYVGWGQEDSDIVLRLISSGCFVRSGRFGASVLHLDHSGVRRHKNPMNVSKFEALATFGRRRWPSKSIFLE